jgi:hypothetical protein
MNFRTNQVLQFYVNNDKNTVNLVNKTADNGTFWFTNTQDGKVVSRTDVIDVDKVLYVTAKQGTKERRYLKGYTVPAPAEIVAGQDYVVKVEFTNYQGMGDMDMTVKVGAAHAKSSTTVNDLMAEIAWTLTKNLKSEWARLVAVVVDGTPVEPTATLEEVKAMDFSAGFMIAEVVQNDWVLGVTPDEGVNFRVYIAPIVVDGEEVNDWITISEAFAYGPHVTNGRKMADLEYFAMGERGDQYRMVGWPNVIKTNYLIDPNLEYSSITIHYAFVDSNEGAQKSERDLMIVGGALSDLYHAISELGITIEGDNLRVA